jgi:hypothetical protein
MFIQILSDFRNKKMSVKTWIFDLLQFWKFARSFSTSLEFSSFPSVRLLDFYPADF